MKETQDEGERPALRGSLFFCLGLLCLTLCLLLLPLRAQHRININTAPVEELTSLPGIGPAIAQRIVAHRQRHGPFKRPQDLVIVRGISARKYRPIAHLIRV